MLNAFVSADYVPVNWKTYDPALSIDLTQLSSSLGVMQIKSLPYKTDRVNLALGFNIVFGNKQDSDKDRVSNRRDKCPDTPHGVIVDKKGCPLDTDGDFVPDCLDACKNDRNKAQPELCGCGVLETDTDKDYTPDCIDACDTDPNKVAAGVCGCGRAETDSDADGTPDCLDTCSSDPSKTQPGICGCGSSDVDTDGDGSYDCQDSCPSDPNKKGTAGCACGSLKDTPGVCGCNVLDTDANGNGQADCIDPTANTTPTAPNYEVSKIGIGRNNTLTILRLRMQGFGGRNVYSYSLTRKGYKLQKTSSTNGLVIRGIKPGTYTFSYSITTGAGARKVTTKVSTSTIKVN
jgi:hypothetical protein